ncbi:MAG: aminoacyltransferase [Oscillospiraceae bacterium]|nr:aminoacyltransferase [Oscillospiraceae bacterium]
MIIAKDKVSQKAYIDFLARNGHCHFQQSPEWARVKSNWKNEVLLAADENGRVTGAMSVLIRKIPLFGNLMYCPRGPICDRYDKETLAQLTDGARVLAKRYKAMALRMEPDIERDDQDFRRLATELGYGIREGSPRTVGIQPQRVFRLDLRGRTEEEIMAGFSSKCRYNIRLAMHRGVTLREGTREDLVVFHRLLSETGARDGFLVRPLSYFQRIWDEFYPAHMRLYLACWEGQPIAGAIPVFYGDRTWYCYGASGNAHRNLMPSYLLQWTMIRLALARRDSVYDLRGYDAGGPAGENNGLYRYKKAFGGRDVALIGEVYLPFSPLRYRAYRLAERLYRGARAEMLGFSRRKRRCKPETSPSSRFWPVHPIQDPQAL